MPRRFITAHRVARHALGAVLLCVATRAVSAANTESIRSAPTGTLLTTAQAGELRDLARRLRAQPTRCVPFVQTKHLAALPRPLIFVGDFSVGTDGSINWRLARPLAVEYLFTVTGGWRRSASTARWESLGLAGTASTATFRVLAALVSLDANALQIYFTVSYSAGPPVQVRAVPKDARLRAVIANAVVDIGTRVQRVEIREANGDWSEYVFGRTSAPGMTGTALPVNCPAVPAAP